MARWIIIFLCACVAGCLAEDPVCSDNEILDNCPVDCADDYCPSSEAQALQACPPSPKPCNPPACKCGFNYRYASAKNKTCIPTRECRPFKCSRPNEEFNPCPPYCPTDSCDEATPDGRCPRPGRILIVLQCTPRCRCIDNYWRQDGVCIPYAECPQNKNSTSDYPDYDEASEYLTSFATASASAVAFSNDSPNASAAASAVASTDPSGGASAGASSAASGGSSAATASAAVKHGKKAPTCSGPNEEYVLEKKSCPSELCSSMVERRDCRNAPPPQPGCACKSGFLRVNKTSHCVPICKCPQMLHSPDCL
ncbi:SCO-spondin-like [Ostrinia nubilalis]|uniref:SCO-spondin-like n=1 Tax=Ostrinia nubilalis TaxID=29057 RepID=UPI003082253C